jgi:hypothetical protein
VRHFGLGVAIALMVLLSGCASTPSKVVGAQPRPTKVAISAQEQKAILAGPITNDEYEAGFRAFSDCLSKKGYTLSNPHIVNDEYEYGIPSAAMSSGLSDKCYDYFWQQVDVRWQTAHINDSETFKIVAACLAKHRVTPTSNYAKNVALLKKNGISPSAC